MRVDLDEPTLMEVAETAGGRYFRATDRSSLEGVYAEIDSLETSEIEVEDFTRYRERFPLFLGGGLVLLLLEVGLSQTAFRKLP